jgi:hypothetical protein
MVVFLRFVMEMISVPHRYVVYSVYIIFNQIYDNPADHDTPSIFVSFRESAYMECDGRILVGCDTVLLHM